MRATPKPQISSDALARLVSVGGRLASAMVATLVTARWLGAAGKGAFSTLHYLSVLLTYACSLGLGEAAIVLVNGRGFRLDRAVSASVLPVVAASAGGVAVLVAFALVAGWNIWLAVTIAGCYIVVGSLGYLLAGVENARLGMRFTSRVTLVSSAVVVALTVLFVGVIPLGVAGAMLAALVASLVSLVMLLRGLRDVGVLIQPAVDAPYLREAVRTGLALEGAHLLMALAQRADLFMVYWLVGEAEAGIYSIALTVGYVSSYAASALAHAAFPRVAAAGQDWHILAVMTARMAALVGLISAVILAILTPITLPLLLGRDFREVVPLSVFLLLGGVVSGIVSSLAHSAAAAGFTSIYVRTFAVTFASMIVLDLVLIPQFEMWGAVAASVLSLLIGLAFVLPHYRNLGSSIHVRDLIPKRADAHRLASMVKSRG